MLIRYFNFTSLFAKKGFKHYKSDYESFDMLAGKKCSVNIGGIDKTVDVLGVNDKGEMLSQSRFRISYSSLWRSFNKRTIMLCILERWRSSVGRAADL